MRNLKKFLALVLAMIMVVSAGAAVSAFDDVAEDNQYAAAIDKLAEYGIVNGTGDGLFSPEDGVNRMQMAIMMARALSPNGDWENGMAIFDDVTEWYGAIAYAYMNNIVTGIGNNLFAPYEGIKYQDALIMAVRALGYTVDVSGTPYWLAAFGQATELGLTKNVAVNKGEQELNRAECAQIIANMISAKPADGGATIEAKNFGIATADNTTTFVITATPKQAYADSYKVVRDDYVGIQKIENGVPAGSIVNIPVADLGIDKADVEDYFNYAVNLVNYNEVTGAYEKAVLGGKPLVVFSKDISRDGDKITVDSKLYYTVEQVTGAALKNEMVVFADSSFTENAKIFLYDKDGNIVDYDGKIVATFAYSTTSGAKYYVDKNVTASGTRVISEAEALEKYGVIVSDSSYTKYTPKKASDIGANAQVSFFDDNGDGLYDRAVYTPVYLAVYDGKDTKIGGVNDKTKFVDATLAKGDVFVGTYNSQTNVVKVLEVLELQYGVLNYLDTSKYNSSNGNNWTAKVIVTTDEGRQTYTVGNDKQNIGATLVKSGDKPTTVANVYNDVRLGWTNNDVSLANLISGFAKAGSPVRFYEYNGYVIVLEAYDMAEKFDRMLILDVITWDSDAVYVDAYLNGKRGEYAISNIDDVEIKGSNALKVSALVSNLYNDVKDSAQLYKSVSNGDSYMIGKALTVGTLDSFNLQQATGDNGTGKYTFLSDGTTGSSATTIRTNSNTTFFFINTDKNTVATYVGVPAKDWSLSGCTAVYADKLGYGNNDNSKYTNNVGKFGVASLVYVYYTDNADIKGFNVANATADKIVYVPTTPTPTDFRSATELNLKDQSGQTFIVYGNVAADMTTGEYVSVYTKTNAPLEKGNFYKVDYQGIATKIETKDYDANNIVSKVKVTDYQNTDMSKYVQIRTGSVVVANDSNKVTNVVTVKADELKSNGALKKDQVISYVKLNGEAYKNTIILVVGGDEAKDPTEPGKVTVNAIYNSFNGSTYGAVANVATKTEEKISGTVYITSTVASYGASVADVKMSGVETVFAGATVTLKNEKGEAVATTSYNASDITIKDDVIAFTIEATYGPFGLNKLSGNYLVEITNSYNSANATIVVPVTIG